VADAQIRPQTGHFRVTGSNYTPGDAVIRSIVGPDGITWTDTLLAAQDGSVEWILPTTCATPTGSFTIASRDVASSMASNPVELTVTSGAFCLDGWSRAKVIAVEDGDTLVLDAPQFPCNDKVRIVGVDTPEMRPTKKDTDKWCVRDSDVIRLATAAADCTFQWLQGVSCEQSKTTTRSVPAAVEAVVDLEFPEGRRCDPSRRLLAYAHLPSEIGSSTQHLTVRLIEQGFGLAFVEEWYEDVVFAIDPGRALSFLVAQQQAQANASRGRASLWGASFGLASYPKRCETELGVALKSPADSADDLGMDVRDVRLEWVKVPRAKQYFVYVGKVTTDGTVVPTDRIPVDRNGLLWRAPESEGRYWWQVGAVVDDKERRSAVWSFTVGPRRSLGSDTQ
jgi:hypothetical protein